MSDQIPPPVFPGEDKPGNPPLPPPAWLPLNPTPGPAQANTPPSSSADQGASGPSPAAEVESPDDSLRSWTLRSEDSQKPKPESAPVRSNWFGETDTATETEAKTEDDPWADIQLQVPWKKPSATDTEPAASGLDWDTPAEPKATPGPADLPSFAPSGPPAPPAAPAASAAPTAPLAPAAAESPNPTIALERATPVVSTEPSDPDAVPTSEVPSGTATPPVDTKTPPSPASLEKVPEPPATEATFNPPVASKLPTPSASFGPVTTTDPVESVPPPAAPLSGAAESRAWQASALPQPGPVVASTNPPLAPRTASPYQAPSYALGATPGESFGPELVAAAHQPVSSVVQSDPGPRRSRQGVTRAGAWAIALIAALLAALLSSGATYFLLMRSNHSLGSATDTKTSSNVVKGLTSGTNVPSVPDSALDGKSPEWSVVAAAVQPTVIAIRVGAADGSGAMGSGVIINAEKGYAVTNNHVVTGAESISVVLADGRIYQAVPRGTDPATDLAVIELVDPPNDLAEAKLGDSEQVVVGEPVMAVGNPLGLDNTVTTGIVSALNRPVNTRAASQGEEPPVDVVTNAIQVDAAVNPGNSGGPLFNAKGEVIGINTSIASLSSPSESAGSIGLAFAIPVNVVANVAGQLIENGTAVHSYLGITPKDAAVEVEGVLRAGAAVVTVQPRTPADEVGLQRGDVVVAVDGKPITGGVSLTAWIRSFDPGDAVTLTVINGNGEARDVDVTLASREDAQQR